MKKILTTCAAVATLVLGTAGTALALPAGATAPTDAQAAQAGSGLNRSCNDGGWHALYTPIPVGTVAVANDPATPQDESKATVFTLTSKKQCRAVVSTGGALGLLTGLPTTTVSIPAPAAFPPVAPPATVTPPALAVLANVVNGSATAPFTFNVVGTGFTASSDVSALVTYKDGHVVVVAVGKTDAAGKITYPVAGACVGSQQPVSVTLLQFPAGPAATVAVPATVCPV
jgi:hypothetical protein